MKFEKSLNGPNSILFERTFFVPWIFEFSLWQSQGTVGGFGDVSVDKSQVIIKFSKITLLRQSFGELIAVHLFPITLHLLPTAYYLLFTIRLINGVARLINVIILSINH